MPSVGRLPCAIMKQIWVATLLLGHLTVSAAEPFLGVTVGYDVDPQRVAPLMRQAGVTTCRLWAAVDYNNRTGVTVHGADVFEQARAFRKLGFRVILLIQNPEPASPDQVKAFFEWAVDHRGRAGGMPLAEAVDAWEILNELNLKEYWTGTPHAYVNDILRPAYEVLSRRSEPVIGGSFTAWQAQADGRMAWADRVERAGVAKAYVDAGYLRWCDFAGLHPYTDSPERMLAVVDAHQSVFGRKDILMTEWNLKTWSDPAAQAKALGSVLPELQRRVAGMCFYRLTHVRGYWGLLEKGAEGWIRSEPFFSAYQQWSKSWAEAP